MPYETLYRKYRPQIFDELIGQTHVKHLLENAIVENKIAHAYLFAGPRGTGKTSTARILAKALNCEARDGYEPCNKCESCKRITNGSSLDVIEMDAASNRGIDEVRSIREQVNYAPIEGKYKVYIIDEVHMLTREAFNALLKTLEEPPPHVIFVLATTEINKLPETILSRCQVLEFKRLPPGVIIESLKEISKKENISISDGALKIIANKANGSMRDAISIFEQVSTYTVDKKSIDVDDVIEVSGEVGKEWIERFVDIVLSGRVKALLQELDALFESGKDPEAFLTGTILYVENRIKSMLGEDSSPLTDVRSLVDLGRKLMEIDREMKLLEDKRSTMTLSLLSYIYTIRPEKEIVKEKVEKATEENVPDKWEEFVKYNLEKGKIDIGVLLAQANVKFEKEDKVKIEFEAGADFLYDMFIREEMGIKQMYKDFAGADVTFIPMLSSKKFLNEEDKMAKLVRKAQLLLGGNVKIVRK